MTQSRFRQESQRVIGEVLASLPPNADDKTKRKAVFDGMRAAGIGVNVHYIPIHTQPYYQNLGFDWGDFPIAEDFYERIISLPMFPELSGEQQQYIADTLAGLLV